uniref:type I protein arginine methyltransferase n=1 Tax=Globodera pallida TaxID=36090 RepID=A0A183BVD6_GLOPA
MPFLGAYFGIFDLGSTLTNLDFSEELRLLRARIAQLERQQTLKLPTSSDGFDLVLNDEIEQQRAAFWAQQTFHGVTLGVVQQPALDELFRQPVVDSWGAGILVSQSIKWTVDFERDPVERLHRIQVPFTVNAQRTCHVHGVAHGLMWHLWAQTPTEPLTHWYQVRCLVKQPMLVLAGQDVRGRLEMVANDKQSYDMELEMCIEGNESSEWQRNVLDLKMPHFRYTGQPTVGPPGT